MYQPIFSISNNILKYIGIIEGAREVISNAPLVPAWERKFQEDAIVRQVHHGTHLEGNALNYSEAAQVVAGNDVIGRPRDIQEVINYRNVIDFIGELSTPETEKIEITNELILKLHKLTIDRILPEEKSGKYRTTQVVVKNSETGEVSFRPPAALEVPVLMDDFIAWLNTGSSDVHPVLTSGIAQYEMVRIHPFVDGNGRVARSVATLALYQKGSDIRRFFSMEEYYDKNAVGYYNALQSVGKHDGDLTLWLEYFTEGLAIELTRIKERIQKLSTDIHLKEKLGGKQVYLTERQIKIVEHIQSIGYLQNKMFPQLFPMISEDTMLREIADLIEKGILIKRGKTKGARYVLKS
ncbi:MAG: Fic family protein [Candidatus Roizmanbacteria bacterium]|nr:Fic family protein [Candidatus Roizmanbacteria bacterium]